MATKKRRWIRTLGASAILAMSLPLAGVRASAADSPPTSDAGIAALIQSLQPTRHMLTFYQSGTQTYVDANAGPIASLLANPTTSPKLRAALSSIATTFTASVGGAVRSSTTTSGTTTSGMTPMTTYYGNANGVCYEKNNFGWVMAGMSVTQNFQGDGRNVTSVQGSTISPTSLYGPGWQWNGSGNPWISSVPASYVNTANPGYISWQVWPAPTVQFNPEIDFTLYANGQWGRAYWGCS